jgi:hypothetical protein
MGAWGYGFFEDDTACDFIYEIEEAENVRQLFQDSFEEAINADYLEYDAGHAVIVSAACIDGIVNGTKYNSDDEEDESDFSRIVAANKDMPLDGLKANAVQALQKVIGENSELNELWSENEDDYPKWRQNILDLMKRLK